MWLLAVGLFMAVGTPCLAASPALEMSPRAAAIAGSYVPAGASLRALAAHKRAQRGGPVSQISVRLGALISPEGAFAGGLDATIPSVSLGSGWIGRVDLDVITRSGETLVPFTFDQVYSTGSSRSASLYVGGGVGAYFGGGSTRFGGKLLFGGYFTRKLSVELGVHFPGSGDTLVTVQARIGLGS